MAVSKRTRYEVLRRDSHTCRYCGATAPDTELTVDHVTPVALGGSDKPANLVAACKDCNAGKASTSPTDQMVQQAGEDDMRWASAIKRAAEQMEAEREGRGGRHEWFVDEWQKWRTHGGKGSHMPLPNGWAKSIDHWLGAGLPQSVLIECIDIAMSKDGVEPVSVFAYMGGVARKKIETLHEMARSILDTEPADTFEHCDHCDWDNPEHADQHVKPCACQSEKAS